MTSAGPTEPSPLVRIRSLLPGLAKAEQRVAHVVLEDPAGVARRSITEVAETAGTSETTVTRFCKAVGVSGYPELRITLAADTARTTARMPRPGMVQVDVHGRHLRTDLSCCPCGYGDVGLTRCSSRWTRWTRSTPSGPHSTPPRNAVSCRI